MFRQLQKLTNAFKITLALLLVSSYSMGQVNGYSFFAGGGEVMETGPFTNLIGTLCDDCNSATTPIGFTFNYGGTNYTSFSATSNGLFQFGGGATVQFTNDLTTLTGPYLSPYWDDNFTDSDGNVQYTLTGVPGTQKLVVDFNLSYLGTQGTADKNFQIWLFEGTNEIRFVYGFGNSVNENTQFGSNGFSVGILTSGTADFLSVTLPGNTVSNSVVNDDNAVWPGTGTYYSFSTIPPCTPVSFLTCPTDISLNNVPTNCGRVVNYNLPTYDAGDCGGDVMTQTDGSGLTSGDLFPVGITTQTYEVTDAGGNTAICSFTVEIIDNELPVITTCPGNITVNSDPLSCGAVVAWAQPTASDNCPGVVMTPVPLGPGSTFPVGITPVVYTATDASGNTASCSFNVEVIDNDAPIIDVCPSDTSVTADAGSCGAIVNLTQPVFTENCAMGSVVSVPASGSFFNVGTTTVVWTLTDNVGNVSTCSNVVTVTDDELPLAVCSDIVVPLDLTGNVSISASDIDGGSTDNCSIDFMSVTPNVFTCTEVGPNTVTLTVTDVNGNVSTCDAIVTVQDVNPEALCQDLTLQLDATGNASITAADVDNGSNDGCGIASMTLDIVNFTCAEVGVNPVVLTVIDNNGLVSTCTSNITVEDNIAPIAVCQDITVQLDALGVATILATDIDGGSSDACGIASYAIDVASFDCSMIGANTVTLTVTDSNGNSSACTATVTVEDNVLPNAICQDLTVQLDASGNATITAADIDNGSNANCGVLSTSIDVSSFDCSNIGPNTVTLTVTDVNGNSATCTSTVTVEDNVNPEALCQDFTAFLDVNGMITVLPSDIDNGSNDPCGIADLSLDVSSFTCAEIGVNPVILTVTDNNGNVSTCSATVTVEDVRPPSVICNNLTVQLDATGNVSISASDIDGGSTDNCAIASTTINTTSFDCSNIGANTVTLTATDVNGNVETCDAIVTVEDNIAPIALCQNITIQLDASGIATIAPSDIDGGSSDACGIASLDSQTDFDCSHVGPNTVTLTVTDNNGNVSTCNATVTVEDNITPVVVCQDVVVQLDATGNVSISAADIDNGSSDACGIATMTLDNTNFTCAEIGSNPVVLTVTDNNGNSSSCSANVIVQDIVAPIAVCQDLIVQLDPTGNISISGADIDGGSTDACGIASLVASPNTFTCAEVGNNIVTLTVTDFNGNTSTCLANVLVEDIVPPVAVCQDMIVQLDAFGNAVITAADIDAGSSDNCAIATLAVAPNTFTCADVGVNSVTLTVTDTYGNVSTCAANVTVEDNVAPTAVCADITVQLDSGGNGSIVAADIDGGSSDACGIANITASQTSFDCSHVGANNVTLTVEDINGNISTCVAIVTVEDNLAPAAVCQPITVELDATGNVSITAADIDNGSTDACGIASTTIDVTSFDCSNVGPNTVTLTVTDVNGNVSTCTSTVTVEDNEAPVASCQDITVQLGATGIATIVASDIDNGSTDACGIADVTLDVSSFDCSMVGANIVTLTVTDVNGNASTCTSTVTVEDNINPIASCQNITVQLDPTGNVTITPADVDGGSSDACGIANMTLDVSTFDCSNIGANAVVLNVTDNNGNSSTCTASVTIEDNVAPTAICQDITVALDATGNATIIAADVDGGSTDACGIASTAIDLNSFDCSNVGPNTVTLTVTDVNGNVSTCTSTVTIEDNEAPIAICQDITVALDATGNATISGLEIDNGSTDACGINTYIASPNSFTCADVGANTVTLTVTDVNGNVSTCTSTVTVEDNEAPAAVCQDIAVALDATGNASIVAADIDNGSTDACGIASTTIDVTSFDCSNVGPNAVTLTITDVNGNASTCTSTVTVEDNVAPDAICQDITVQLDATGNVTITANDIDGGSTDACGIASTTIDLSSFDCSNVGVNTVTLTVTDVNGNVSTCTADVTVEDIEGPIVICQSDVTITADAGVCESAAVVLVAPATTDNCGVASITNDGLAVYPVGTTLVTWTITDVNGNVSTCSQNVTVTDDELPSIVCPADITVSADAGVCTSSTTLINPSTADNCGVLSVTNDAPTDFPLGSTIVTWTVEDIHGNLNTCTQEVIVTDDELPTITCPTDVTVDTDPSVCVATNVILGTPVTDDNCSVAAVTNDAPAVFPLGNTTVTWTVEDGSGNISTCTQVVTVEDNEAPAIQCPLDVVADIVPGSCGRVIMYPTPVVLDNCAVLSMVQTDGTGYTSGSVFPIGTTVQEYTVTDAAGNVFSCNFNITINDPEFPVLTSCPSDMTVYTSTNSCDTPVSWLAPVASDNCGGVILTANYPSGSLFPVGTTTVTYTATDAGGNAVTCSFNVEVIDNVAPVAPVLEDVYTSCEVTLEVPTAQDNCAGTVIGTTSTIFPITATGITAVTWVFDDGNGNVSNAVQFVNNDGVVDATVSVLDGVTLMANNSDATYQWITCPDNMEVDGATQQMFVADANASYGVIVTEEGCPSAISTCFDVSIVGIEDFTLEELIVYPNPSLDGQFTIQYDGQITDITLYDMVGRVVTVPADLTTGKVNASDLANGKYMVRVTTDKGMITKEIIVLK
ncbi:MAG: HYR domain-containing protein [Crocinitomicaceae bacterium]|nr:HYR domain-containing protein [Crocinitomicaceae bacterium]